jgi:hypothetical protein
MKNIFLIFIFFSLTTSSFSQTNGTMKKITDSICDCLSKKDLSVVKNAEDANKVFMECFLSNVNLLMDLAQERHVDFSDQVAMRNLGLDIGKELVKENCAAFMKLSMKMAGEEKPVEMAGGTSGVTGGRLTRVDTKDFRYFVISDANKRESSFIWLHYFPGSEKFIENPGKYVGKDLKINWQETEVFLPAAKGYFKIKEITGIVAD